jgi:hypothetical protein
LSFAEAEYEYCVCRKVLNRLLGKVPEVSDDAEIPLGMVSEVSDNTETPMGIVSEVSDNAETLLGMVSEVSDNAEAPLVYKRSRHVSGSVSAFRTTPVEKYLNTRRV